MALHQEHVVLRVVAKMLIPMILLFALYVQFHGDYGPGGGFQAGVIFAAGIILYALVFGLGAARQVVPPPVLRRLAALGVLLFYLAHEPGVSDGAVLFFGASVSIGVTVVPLGSDDAPQESDECESYVTDYSHWQEIKAIKSPWR